MCLKNFLSKLKHIEFKCGWNCLTENFESMKKSFFFLVYYFINEYVDF